MEWIYTLLQKQFLHRWSSNASVLEAIYGVANKLDFKTISALLASILIKIFNHIASFFLRLFQEAHHRGDAVWALFEFHSK